MSKPVIRFIGKLRIPPLLVSSFIVAAILWLFGLPADATRQVAIGIVIGWCLGLFLEEPR